MQDFDYYKKNDKTIFWVGWEKCEQVSEGGKHTEGERERGRGSSDGGLTQALNINAACLGELKAAVHQNLGETA